MIFVDGLGRLALDGLVVRQKLPQDLRSIRIDHNNTSKQAPGPENRHPALYASIIAYLYSKRNKIFILLRSYIPVVRRRIRDSIPAASGCCRSPFRLRDRARCGVSLSNSGIRSTGYPQARRPLHERPICAWGLTPEPRSGIL